MKKILYTLLTLILAAVMALCLIACGGEETPEARGPKEDVSVYHSGDGYETINDMITWDKINAFPVVHDGMTVEEGRKLVVDFFRYCKTSVWVLDDTYEYKIREEHTDTITLQGGSKYGGLPYIVGGTGSVYRLMDYMDPETGVVDIQRFGANPRYFGNQCSYGSYVGVCRVINSCKYGLTMYMNPMNGFVPVGDYKIRDDVEKFTEDGYNTPVILRENGEEVMYESYAGLKKGDVIVYYTTAGHVVVIAEDATVVRDGSGKVDPTQSYVQVLDQTATHVSMTNQAGDTFQLEANVDAKWTFQKLFLANYVPYTFKEWTGEDPIESSKTEYSHSGETITLSELYKSKVTANYGVMDLYASVYHSNGKEVYKVAARSNKTSNMELAFSKPTVASVGNGVDAWGSEEELDPSQEYTVKVYAQLTTGERPVVWEGKLVLE